MLGKYWVTYHTRVNLNYMKWHGSFNLLVLHKEAFPLMYFSAYLLIIALDSILYFAVYNAHFLSQFFEGKIRMCIIHGCNDYIPWV